MIQRYENVFYGLNVLRCTENYKNYDICNFTDKLFSTSHMNETVHSALQTNLPNFMACDSYTIEGTQINFCCYQ